MIFFFLVEKPVPSMCCALVNNILSQPTSAPSHWVTRGMSPEKGRQQDPGKLGIGCPVFLTILPDADFLSRKCPQLMVLYLTGNDNDYFL